MSKPTFRDFAAAVMQGDVNTAAGVLKELLDLEQSAAELAAHSFAARMKSEGQPFMMKAMGLRNLLAEGSDEEIGVSLVELFGLPSTTVDSAIQALRDAYG